MAGLILTLGSNACGPTGKADSIQLSADCMSAGMKSFDHLKEDVQEHSPGLTVAEPKYHFNPRLHACLMQVEYWSPLGGVKAVINVYENKTILGATDSRGANGTTDVAGERNGQPDKRVYVSFDSEAEKLMSE